MSRIRKFRAAGEPLTLGEVVEEIKRGNYVMVHQTPTHPGWIGSWQVNTLINSCAHGRIRRAEITDEWLVKNRRNELETVE